MKRIFAAIRSNPLFDGVTEDEFGQMYSCLSARTVRYSKDDVILLAGNTIDSVGLLISGSVRILKEDRNGNVSIMTELSRPDVFGEVFACAGVTESPVTIQATEDTEVFFIGFRKIITTCTSACPFHSRLVENMLKLVALKTLALNQKIELLSRRTTREKLLGFFEMYSGGEKKFSIPFNREGLARYLCVDRSAMSNELCKMRDEGLIRFNKSSFEIL